MRYLDFGTYALMIVIVFWGVLLGGVVYSHIVYFPVYLSDLPASSVLVNGPFALHEENFWLLIHPMLVTALGISLIANWKDPARRRMILVPLIIYVFIIGITALYFIPELGEFKNSNQTAITPQQWLARAQRWQYLSWVRGSTLFILIAPLLVALARPYQEHNANG